MRERFYFGKRRGKRRLRQVRPVPGRTGAFNVGVFGKGCQKGAHLREKALQGVAFVIFVPLKDKTSFGIDDNTFDGGAT